MSRKTLLLAAAGLSLICVVAIAAPASEESEQEITLDQAPAAVQATILKEAAGAKITEVERETKDGKTIYEAEFMLDGKEIEIQVAPDGTLLGREVEAEDDDEDDLSIDQVPAAARAALLKLAGGAKIVKAEREREHGVMIYEAEWIKDGVEHEAAVTEDGTLVEIEEIVPADKAPAAVRAAIAKHFGHNAKVVVEKKMIVVYEIEAEIDGEEKELLVFPTGRVHDQVDEDDDHNGDDDDEHEDDDDDD